MGTQEVTLVAKGFDPPSIFAAPDMNLFLKIEFIFIYVYMCLWEQCSAHGSHIYTEYSVRSCGYEVHTLGYQEFNLDPSKFNILY